MKRLMERLRVRLALTGFVAIYAPVIVLVNVVNIAEEVTVGQAGSSSETVQTVESGVVLGPVLVVAALLAPVAALLAWWWAGRAVRPLQEAVVIQQQLVEETSHELRTPLAVLSTNADVLLRHPEPTLDVYRAGIERSRIAAGRMSATIDSLLVDARGRARSIVRRPVDVADVVAQTIDGLQPLAVASNIALQLQPSRPVRARVDELSVERAITNLVANAIEASPTGSAVTVSVAEAERTVEVSVTDQGDGMAPDDKAPAFDRYWQADDGDGAGIGLSIVQQIALAHGGDVTVHSPVDNGRGSRFCFTVMK